MGNRLTVRQAAELLGASEQYVRVLIQTGQLPIGFTKAGEDVKRRGYIIPRPLFTKVTGIEVPEEVVNE